MQKNFASKSVTDTIDFGKRLGRILQRGDIIALSGELGSGKTVLTKGIADGLGVKSARYVNSPSFVVPKDLEDKISLKPMKEKKVEIKQEIQGQ